MKAYKGGETVGKGTYWNLSTMERMDVETEGTLPGNRSERFFRMSAAGILVLGPVLGLVYAMFLPFIGIAMTLKLGGEKIAARVLEPALSASTFGWRPAESYLSGKKKASRARKEEEKKEDPDRS